MTEVLALKKKILMIILTLVEILLDSIFYSEV